MTKTKTRLNTDLRKKIGGLILSHFENEKTTEYENFKSAKEDITVAYDRTFKTAIKVVQRAYPTDDVATLQKFKDKYGRAVDVVAKDSCFYFADTQVIKDNLGNDDNAEHFDFKLDASMSGRFNSIDFGLAYFRDELKGAGLNPEINIQQQEKQSSPYLTQELDKCKKFLGMYQGDTSGISEQWKNKYSLDVIGTSYCRSRTIPCSANEFEQMRAFKNARQVFVQSHYTWAENIHKDMQQITNGLKDYKYLSDAIELAGRLGLNVSENELQRTVGVSLTIYQPENLANLILSRRVKQDNKAVIARFKKARQVQASVN
jgi:hypothetical protein